MGRCCRIPCWRPTCCLPVKHSQLVVDTLGTLMRLHRGRLLLLLRSQVPEYPVNGRHLQKDGDFRLELIRKSFINSILGSRKCYKSCCQLLYFLLKLLATIFVKIINKFVSKSLKNVIKIIMQIMFVSTLNSKSFQEM